jgi:DnaJ-class molecular chaperone
MENPTGLELLCPSCNGEGTQKTIRTCKDCNGTGFSVRVYEFNDEIHSCLSCSGTGWINEEIRYSDLYGNHIEQRQVKCPICDGSGFNISYRYKTIK